MLYLFTLSLFWLLCVIPLMELRWEGSWILGLAIFDVGYILALIIILL